VEIDGQTIRAGQMVVLMLLLCPQDVYQAQEP
jgi:hypothetical protein